MKYTIILLSIIGAIGLTQSVQAYNHHVIYVETPSGQVLEMPVYKEAAINETIPGVELDDSASIELQDEARQALGHSNLARVLLCITKQEETEPFPCELN
jgi:hypothetical protein